MTGVVLSYAVLLSGQALAADGAEPLAISLAPADPSESVSELPADDTSVLRRTPAPPSILQGLLGNPPVMPTSALRQSAPSTGEGIRPAQAALRPMDPSLSSEELSLDECGGWCGCVWSHWTVDLDAVFLRRSTPKTLALARSNPGGIDPNTREMRFDHEAGPRLAVIRRGISGFDVELNYLGIEGFHAILDMPNAEDPRLPGDDFGGLFSSPGLFVGARFDYVSRLHSEELNLRHAWGDYWTVLVGFRAVQLYERLHVQVSAPLIDYYTITTDNRLYGVQIGGEGKIAQFGAFSISTTLKAGLFDNNSEQTTTDLAGFLASSPTNSELTASTNQSSFLGEIGITGVYRASETSFLRAGYHWLWISDLALATDQIPVNEFDTNLTPPPNTALRGIATRSSLGFHGATVGVELAW